MNFSFKGILREIQEYKLLLLIFTHDFLKFQAHQEWMDWHYSS